MLKNIKNILLALSISLTAMHSANAALISHDIILDDKNVGSIVIDTDKADSFGEISTWESFQIDMFGFSFDMLTEKMNPDLFGGFSVQIDPSNLLAGIEGLFFDVTESRFGVVAFNGIFDSGTGILDMFSTDARFFGFGTLTLGQATVVPEPPMLLLFLTGLVAVGLKRRKTK